MSAQASKNTIFCECCGMSIEEWHEVCRDGSCHTDCEEKLAARERILAGKAELRDVIQFVNERIGGYGRPKFPTLTRCQTCGNLGGVLVDIGDGKPHVRIDNPVLAAKVSLLWEGYNLERNEGPANSGRFRFMDGHDGHPDDWKFIDDPFARRCHCRDGEDEAEPEAQADDGQD